MLCILININGFMVRRSGKTMKPQAVANLLFYQIFMLLRDTQREKEKEKKNYGAVQLVATTTAAATVEATMAGPMGDTTIQQKPFNIDIYNIGCVVCEKIR